MRKDEIDYKSLCVHHNKPKEYICLRCDHESFICRVCWRNDHRESTNHEVVPLSMIFDECNETKGLSLFQYNLTKKIMFVLIECKKEFCK